MNPAEIIEKINHDNRYLSYVCYEAGKKNKIFLLVNEIDFHMIFPVGKGEYQDVVKTHHDIVNVLVTASGTIGFEAKITIEFKDMTTGVFRVRDRFEAIEILSRMMCLPYSPDSPFTNCNAIQDREKIKNNFINIDSQFAKRVNQKRIRFALLLIMIFIIVAAIAFGVVALVVPL
jgi:hypothetical protein